MNLRILAIDVLFCFNSKHLPRQSIRRRNASTAENYFSLCGWKLLIHVFSFNIFFVDQSWVRGLIAVFSRNYELIYLNSRWKVCACMVFLHGKLFAAYTCSSEENMVCRCIKEAGDSIGCHAGPSPGFSSRGGQKPEGGVENQKGGTFFKYSIGSMQQPGG